jgi:hypothetical protein
VYGVPRERNQPIETEVYDVEKGREAARTAVEAKDK